LFKDVHPLLGVIASIVVGVVVTYLTTLLRSRLRGREPLPRRATAVGLSSRT
jgi:hypothetical protein